MNPQSYERISPIDGLWPEWPGLLALTYNKKTESSDLAELFWTRPHQFLGCAECGVVHPLEQKWINALWRHKQLFYCRKCASKIWPDDRERFHSIERQFRCQESFHQLWYRHQLQSRINELLNRAKIRSILLGCPFDLAFGTLHELWYEQAGRCGSSGELMLLRCNEFREHDHHEPSLDRKFPQSGYLNANVHLTCWKEKSDRGHR